MPSFFSTFGRLPGTSWILGLSVFAGLFEGFGLTLFVPLLALMNDSGADQTGLLAIVTGFMTKLDLRVEVGSMLVVMTLLIVVGFLLGYIQRRAVHKAFNDYILVLRHKLLGGMLNSSWPHLSKQASGEVVSNLILETSQTSTGLMMQVHIAVSAIQVVVLGSFSAVLSPLLFSITVVFSLLIVLMSLPFLRRSDLFGKGLTKANQRFGFHTVDYLRGAYLIKTTAAEDISLERLDSLSDRVYRMRLGLDLLSALFQFLLQVSPVILVATLIAAGYFWLGIETATILTFLLMMARTMPRVAEVQQRYQSYLSYRPAFVVVDTMIEACERNAERVLRSGRQLPNFSETIKFEGVSLRFADSQSPLIDNVHLEIPRNHMVALVGSSGAGKTTVINLLAGLYRPDTGSVLIDGVDLEDIDLREWRSKIGYVTQDAVTFNDTIRNNLCFAKSGLSDQDIQDALAMANLDSFVAQLPDGLDTVVGENGVRLSGGQRQRLALARALLGKPSLLLLDEATSALDNETERVIQNAIETLADHLTIIVVAHRLSTITRADHVYVMEEGRVVESGNYSSLLAQNGRFAELHDLQLRTGS
ncbi:MAG: ABC transporter ATP-binding protein [Rhodospirillaceae bacterium]|nr:ABC transporter ATP-binding protein [Rhodospirillaceae bacterium]MBT5459365.1 ABC transporter ATP-binding protein [Rhodospirillaceae bacterium]